MQKETVLNVFQHVSALLAAAPSNVSAQRQAVDLLESIREDVTPEMRIGDYALYPEYLLLLAHAYALCLDGNRTSNRKESARNLRLALKFYTRAPFEMVASPALRDRITNGRVALRAAQRGARAEVPTAVTHFEEALKLARRLNEDSYYLPDVARLCADLHGMLGDAWMAQEPLTLTTIQHAIDAYSAGINQIALPSSLYDHGGYSPLKL